MYLFSETTQAPVQCWGLQGRCGESGEAYAFMPPRCLADPSREERAEGTADLQGPTTVLPMLRRHHQDGCAQDGEGYPWIWEGAERGHEVRWRWKENRPPKGPSRLRVSFIITFHFNRISSMKGFSSRSKTGLTKTFHNHVPHKCEIVTHNHSQYVIPGDIST